MGGTAVGDLDEIQKTMEKTMERKTATEEEKGTTDKVRMDVAAD